MNQARSLNRDWLFKEGFDSNCFAKHSGELMTDGYRKVQIPHTVKEIPYDCFDQQMTCLYTTYLKLFSLEGIRGKRILVSFEGVSAVYDLYCNGIRIGSHRGAYSMALFDLTEAVREGENILALQVDSHERPDTPPNGSTVDFLIYGGIYRDVTLYVQEQIYAVHALGRYSFIPETDDVLWAPELFLVNRGITEQVSVTQTIERIFPESSRNPEQEISGTGSSGQRDSDSQSCQKEESCRQDEQVFRLESGECSFTLSPRTLKNICRWNPEDPVMYRIRFTVRGEDGRLLDELTVRTGFRTISVSPEGFCLNGKHILLQGLNRHQSFPYVGYALGKRAQEKDAELLHDFLGVNMVRCSHYMQSRYFLDRCDELGLLVFEEIPGWGYLGGEDFREIVIQDLENMVIGHFNHPSIVIWGTRLNETTDHDDFYRETNRRCKEMDPSRPTTGARWDTGSRLLEDIYCFNDYSEDEGGEFVLKTPCEAAETTKPIPYLVSEHSGAIVPTKPWDSEERQEQFALRHASVLSRIRTSDEYLGAIGWCMCDYNTHNDHNSLEKICYHGVLDMFRVPKMAAYLYASQKPPSMGVVMEPCSMVGRGERCEPVPFRVLTNCDYIEVKLSTDEVHRYYPSTKYAGMAHPPIEVTQNGEFWQNRWEGAVIEGYVDGKPAARKVYSNNPRLSGMKVTLDSRVLSCNEQDETRLVAIFHDENGNRLYYLRGCLEVEPEENSGIERIGPRCIPVMGGAAACWIRTKAEGVPGIARVVLHTERSEIPDQTLEITLI